MGETWWDFFPGVSRSFLNSSGTKITAKNIRKKNRNLKIIFLLLFIKFDDSRHAQLSIYTVFHEESGFEVENNNFCQLDVKNEEKRGEYYQVFIFKVFCDPL